MVTLLLVRTRRCNCATALPYPLNLRSPPLAFSPDNSNTYTHVIRSRVNRSLGLKKTYYFFNPLTFVYLCLLGGGGIYKPYLFQQQL